MKMRIYYVVGIADTRQEFEVKGVSTSKAKADKFRQKLQDKLFENSRCWAEIREVGGI